MIAEGLMRPAFQLEGSVTEYWKARQWQHTTDTYRGRSLCKFPEDLRTYEHIIDVTKPEVIVELGTHEGGSALWFADRLTTLCGQYGRVITVDVGDCDVDDGRITFFKGDLRDLADKVTALVAGRRAMVVEDSAHDHGTTIAALRLYGPLVQEHDFFVVEDTIVDAPSLSIWNSGGVSLAIDDFLLETSRFERVPLALYGITMHMGGWLQAVA